MTDTLFCVFKCYKSEIFVVRLGIRKFVSLLGSVIKQCSLNCLGKTFLNVKKHFSSAPTPAINNDCFPVDFFSLLSFLYVTLIQGIQCLSNLTVVSYEWVLKQVHCREEQ